MILFGKVVQENMSKELIKYTTEQKISFTVISIGNNFASKKYINNKLKYADKINIKSQHINLNEKVKEEEVLQLINKLNKDETVNGIILQLPIPKHLNEFKLTQSIAKEKDIDGFNTDNIGNTYLDKKSLVSCTAYGVINILDFYKIPIEGKNICIAGRSNLVGKILAILLINRGATVTSCNSKTKKIKSFINNSDIFISAIGSPHFFDDSYFDNQNLTIIDVGTNFQEGKLVGDVDFEQVKDKVQNITPVPGGVGVLTVTNLMNNVVKAHKKQKENRR